MTSLRYSTARSTVAAASYCNLASAYCLCLVVLLSVLLCDVRADNGTATSPPHASHMYSRAGAAMHPDKVPHRTSLEPADPCKAGKRYTLSYTLCSYLQL